MNLMKKIKEWQRENVIDDVTAEKISQYEQSHSKPVVLWAFGGMGAFAVIVGIVSVIAANWGLIPDGVKLGADLVVCLLLAVALYWSCSKHDVGAEKLWLREVLVVVYYGFTLASMALIGQTYQLGGTLEKLLLVWTLVTIPLVLIARGRFIAVLWFTATSLTYVLNINVLYELAEHHTDFNTVFVRALIISLYVLMPLLFILISRIPWLLRERGQVAEELSRYAWFALVVMGFFFQFLWYENMHVRHILSDLIMVCFIATAGMMYFIPKLYSKESADTHLAMRVVLAIVFILGTVGAWYSNSIELIGALSNLTYLCVLAWAAIKIKSMSLFNILTAFICLRILAIYFEVFGSMLETGLGLIVGGILTLLISWWWFKRSNSLASRLGLPGKE